jgi:fluoride exporter
MKGVEILLLAAGGVIGTLLRYRITESQIVLGAFYANVLIANIIGSFLLGVFMILSQYWNLDAKYALFVAVGFCGSLTTMSAFALQSSSMIDNKQFGLLAVNILGNVGLSIGAIYAGRVLAMLVTGAK